MKLNILFILALLAGISFTGCEMLSEEFNEPTYENPIEIGLIMPVLNERNISQMRYLAAELAVTEINNSGGVLERPLKLVRKDDEGNADVGVQRAEELIDENIRLVIGPGWSGITLAVSNKVAIENKMLLLSFSATNPVITDLDDNGYVNRVCPSDLFQGKIGAEFLYNDLGKKTVGIIYKDETFTAGLAKAIKDTYEQLGGTVTNYVPYAISQEYSSFDFSEQVQKVLEGEPESVYFVSYTDDAIGVSQALSKELKNMNKPNYKPTFMTIDEDSEDFLTNGAADILEGLYGITPKAPDDYENYVTFKNGYEAAYGFLPNPYCEHMYDAVYSMALAIEEAKTTNSEIVKDHLQTVTGGFNTSGNVTKINVNEFAKAIEVLLANGEIDYEGASGKIDLDENGDPSSATSEIWQITGGEFHSLRFIEYSANK